MKKLSILPIALVLAVGAVWANSLFPNTDEFPAFPTGAGTI